METVYLSPHFSENTYLVAGKCPKCYRESEDVRIIGMNSVFLKKYTKTAQVLYKFDFSKEFFVCLDEFKTINDVKRESPEFFKESKILAAKFGDDNNNDEKGRFKIKFVPPKSPYNLIEEHLYHDPWKLLVATIFLNRTTLKFSKDHLEWFLNTFDSPDKLLQTDVAKLEKYFEPLGLHKTRAKQVYYMTHDYMFKKWRSVEEIFGIGDYGRDAYNMFCLGNFDVAPKDRYLRIYKDWYQKVYLRSEEEFAEHFYRAVSQKDAAEDDA